VFSWARADQAMGAVAASLGSDRGRAIAARMHCLPRGVHPTNPARIRQHSEHPRVCDRARSPAPFIKHVIAKAARPEEATR